MINFRPATAKDARDFYGKTPPSSFKGIVAVEGEDVVGIGGIFRKGSHLVAFTELKPAMRPYKKAIAKGCRIMVDMIKKETRPVYAVADLNEPTSSKLLAKIGFVPTGLKNEFGETLIWRGE